MIEVGVCDGSIGIEVFYRGSFVGLLFTSFNHSFLFLLFVLIRGFYRTGVGAVSTLVFMWEGGKLLNYLSKRKRDLL